MKHLSTINKHNLIVNTISEALPLYVTTIGREFLGLIHNYKLKFVTNLVMFLIIYLISEFDLTDKLG